MSARAVTNRILFVVAGTRRNATKDSPTLRLLASPEFRDVHRVFVFAPAAPNTGEKDGGATPKQVADTLKTEIGKLGRPRGVEVVEVEAHAGDHHDRALARAPHLEAVRNLMGNPAYRLRGSEPLVSALTGSPAQWSLILEALEEHGAAPRLVCATEGGLRVLGPRHERHDEGSIASRRSRRTLSQHLDALANVPDSGVVLVRGETGAGKSRFARLLHERWNEAVDGAGAKSPFRAVDCGALPENLVESELFGSKRGAFTGAEDRRGAFEESDGGTLFLDEIGEIEERVQAKLLTALDVDENGFRHYRVVGGPGKKARLRLVLGTNRDLGEYVAKHRFRLDLLARISTHEVHLPPLRATPHRIPSAYLDEFEALSKAYGRMPSGARGRAGGEAATRPKGPRVRFVLPADALRRLFDFLTRAEDWWWPWNYRDVFQSAQRLALAAWGSRRDDQDDGMIQIKASAVAEEVAFLEERWRSLRTEANDGGGWSDLEAAFGAAQVADWSLLERCEVRAMLRAKKCHPDNDAAAYREFWRELHPGRSEPTKRPANPSTLWRQTRKRLGLEG